MRTFSTSVMLMIAALPWGDCFSCPQLLLAAQETPMLAPPQIW
jgi:hypothetical protein